MEEKYSAVKEFLDWVFNPEVYGQKGIGIDTAKHEQLRKELSLIGYELNKSADDVNQRLEEISKKKEDLQTMLTAINKELSNAGGFVMPEVNIFKPSIKELARMPYDDFACLGIDSIIDLKNSGFPQNALKDLESEIKQSAYLTVNSPSGIIKVDPVDDPLQYNSIFRRIYDEEGMNDTNRARDIVLKGEKAKELGIKAFQNILLARDDDPNLPEKERVEKRTPLGYMHLPKNTSFEKGDETIIFAMKICAVEEISAYFLKYQK